MQHRIRAISGPMSGSVYALGQVTTIGRSGETDVQILGKGISREHAYIIKDDHGNMVLVDMSSKNGTLVEGKPIKRHDLARGDRFEIGDSEFVYEQVEASEAPDLAELKLLSGPAVAVTAETAKHVDAGDAIGESEETIDLRLLRPPKAPPKGKTSE